MPRTRRAAVAVLLAAALAASLPLPATALDAARAASPGSVLATIPTGPKPQDAIVSPDGRYGYVTTLNDGAVTKIDLESLAVVASANVGTTAGALAWRGDELLVADAAGRRIVAVDPDSLAVTGGINGEGADPISIAVSADGSLVAFSADTVRGVSFNDDELLRGSFVDIGGATWGLDLFAGDTRVLVADRSNARVVAIAADTADAGSHVVGEVFVGGRPSYIAVAPDESVAYVANADRGAVDVVDLDRLEVIASYPVGGKPWGVAVSWEGRYLYVPDNSGGALIAVDTQTGRVLSTTPTGSFPDFVALSPDGTRVLVPNSGSNSLSVLQGYSSPPAVPAEEESEEEGAGADAGADEDVPGASAGVDPLGLVLVIVGVAVLVLAAAAVVVALVVRSARRGSGPTPPVLDPALPAAELARLAQDPALRPAVAAHPNAYPELLEWLAGLGDPAVDAALRRRG